MCPYKYTFVCSHGAQQNVLLGCLSIPESFVKIEQSRKKFYFIREGSKKLLAVLRATSVLHKTGADTKKQFFGPESKTVENFSQVMK